MILKSLTLGTIVGSLEVITILIAKVLKLSYVTPFSDVYVTEFRVALGRNSKTVNSVDVVDATAEGFTHTIF